MEPPGTAPGSDPLIARAFMSIVPKDTLHLTPAGDIEKGSREIFLGQRQTSPRAVSALN